MNDLIGPEAAVLLITTAFVVGIVLYTWRVRKRLTDFLTPRGFTPEPNPPEIFFDERKFYVAQAFSGQLAPGVKGLFMTCSERIHTRKLTFYLGVWVPDSAPDAEQQLAGADRLSRQAGGVIALWKSKDSPEEVAKVLTTVEAALKGSRVSA